MRDNGGNDVTPVVYINLMGPYEAEILDCMTQKPHAHSPAMIGKNNWNYYFFSNLIWISYFSKIFLSFSAQLKWIEPFTCSMASSLQLLLLNFFSFPLLTILAIFIERCCKNNKPKKITTAAKARPNYKYWICMYAHSLCTMKSGPSLALRHSLSPSLDWRLLLRLFPFVILHFVWVARFRHKKSFPHVVPSKYDDNNNQWCVFRHISVYV